MTIDSGLFRQVLGHFPTGVTIITATGADGTPVGLTIGSFTSVSLDPPLVGFLPMTDSERWKAIEAAGTKQLLEDLYLPYKPKRRTRAQIAREAGLEPLANALLADPSLDPQAEAARYILVKPASEGVEAINVPDAKAALDGARDILAERFAETAELLAKFEEGNKLLKTCEARLKDAELKIEQLRKQKDGVAFEKLNPGA